MTLIYNRKKACLAMACGVAVALAVPTVEGGGRGWTSCGSIAPCHRNYYYSRRPNRFDPLSYIRSIPIYFNSLHRQAETQAERMERSALRYEIHEGPDGGIELTLEVPGVEAKDLSVELEDGHVLRIHGSRHHRQRGSTTETKFDQMFSMDDDIDIDKLSVTLSSGLLRISAPRKEKHVRKIPIENLDVAQVVEAKAIPELKSNRADEVDVNVAKDLNEAQAESQEVVDELTITEEDE